MKFQSLLVVILLVVSVTAATFNIQVTSTCTNYTGTACTAWTQTGSIIENTAACLPGNTELLTETGPKQISDIRIGDRVLTYNPITKQDEYANVEAWLHRAPNKLNKYLKLHTNKLQLVISAMHSLADSLEYTFSFAYTMLGKDLIADIGNQTVISIQQVNQIGIFAPLTSNNNLYVNVGHNKILVHCYANIASPQSYESYFSPAVRLYERFFPYQESEIQWLHPIAKLCKYLLGSLLVHTQY